MTPEEFETQFGTNQRTLRSYLRRRWPDHLRNDQWVLTSAMVADAREHFGIAMRACPGNTPSATDGQIGRPCLANPKTLPARTPGSAFGLHRQVQALALNAGIPLALGQTVPWLSRCGHLDEFLGNRVPDDVITSLSNIHRVLGGDASLLGAKRLGGVPIPDLVHLDLGCIIEVDEIQHFTSARLQSFDYYPPGIRLGFARIEYAKLATHWRGKGDRAFAYKAAADFPWRGGRQAQRAYNDALRDLLAPTFTNYPVIRIPVPDRSLCNVVERLQAALEGLK